jgi:GNAT superfamily N-acetyltransferase
MKYGVAIRLDCSDSPLREDARMTVIRGGRPDDVPALVALLDELFTLEADLAPDRALQERGLALLLERDDAFVAVADDRDRVVGMATVQLIVSTAEGGPAGVVEDVIVAASHRRAGIATALLDRLAEWCSERGVGRMQLLADRENAPALAFYGARGWQPTQLVALRRRVD